MKLYSVTAIQSYLMNGHTVAKDYIWSIGCLGGGGGKRIDIINCSLIRLGVGSGG